jgi:putative nucleotidyltransferase with HDIG domain
VAELAVAIAGEMGLDESRIQGQSLGSLIHDIGKIYIPAEILNRPGRLSAAEFEMIKSHPQVGYDIIRGVEFPWPVAEMILQHHERLDGSGYPHGLRGDEICAEARILAVADVVEAMSSHRPYRPGLGLPEAVSEIRRGRGARYDAAAVDACLRLIEQKGFQFEESARP